MQKLDKKATCYMVIDPKGEGELESGLRDIITVVALRIRDAFVEANE